MEVVQSGEKLQGEDHVCIDAPKATVEQQGEAADGHKGHLPAVLGKTVTLEPVGKDKHHKSMEVEKSLGRRHYARGKNREQVIQADGVAAGACMCVHVQERGETLNTVIKSGRSTVVITTACPGHMLISLLRFALSYLTTCFLLEMFIF